MSEVPYREVVHVSLWCSLMCRQDLSYAVNQVAKLYIKPSIVHWEAVQRILLYVYQRKDWRILYQGHIDHSLVYDPVINFVSW